MFYAVLLWKGSTGRPSCWVKLTVRSCKTECKMLQFSFNKWPLRSGFFQSPCSGCSAGMDGKSTEKWNLNRKNVMQAGRELCDLGRSDREPEGCSLTDFWRSSAEAVAEVACGRGAAGLEGSSPDGVPACPAAGEKCMGWGGFGVSWITIKCVCSCSKAARRLQGFLLGRSRQERGATHPLVRCQGACETEVRVGNHCGDIPTSFLLLPGLPHMVGSETDCSPSHLLSSRPLCKLLGVPKFYGRWCWIPVWNIVQITSWTWSV